ncbi:stage II sporulation protein R [Paenibacillus yanchengensis]|uniref:Stage II sporulation protein R n=1 Tax=Paenibacillus yanchengensis TaxID=2035833 RepID=A0ABW4YMZ4_9BACL
MSRNFKYRSSFGYIVFAIILIIMSWESQLNDEAIAGAGQSIPEQAIRLRILANSDQPEDQLIKRVIRDEVVATMNTWVDNMTTIDDARQLIKIHLPEIEQVVAQTLTSRGYTYDFQVELDEVEFPAKMYGNKIYPAGMYEALRISLGEAEGQNWWCVLFPPLCFVDAVSSETSSAEALSTTTAEEATTVAVAEQPSDEQPEVKFFIADLFQSVGQWVKGLFA